MAGTEWFPQARHCLKITADMTCGCGRTDDDGPLFTRRHRESGTPQPAKAGGHVLA
jgi:hypothetical protein